MYILPSASIHPLFGRLAAVLRRRRARRGRPLGTLDDRTLRDIGLEPDRVRATERVVLSPLF